MDIGTAITILGATANLATIGTAVKDFLIASLPNQADVNSINAALAVLPNVSSPSQIVEILYPIFTAKGGAVTLSAGDDSGGNLTAEDIQVTGGSGPGGGGDVLIKGGDGGPLGKGGDTVITGGVIRGGDAK